MKKLLTLILVLALSLTACLGLTACGDNAEDKNVKIGVQEGTTSLMYADCLKGVTVSSYTTFPFCVISTIKGMFKSGF